ncbi:MAG: hypothetical protein DRR08_16745 [Candidatus Parabeggiatoa sp. nov. 2]|nr:MAG: hypothetical protein DRR08_16745 [Gammaproteobacteria bacterium]
MNWVNSFINLGSLGIMIGGLTAMSPLRRNEIISLGVKTIFAVGNVTATVVELII